MAKNNRTSKNVPATLETTPEVVTLETVEVVSAPVETTPEVPTAPTFETFEPGKKGSARFATKGARDVYGFGSETFSSAFYRLVSTGEYTEAELKEAIAIEFPGSVGKSTFGVTLSDSRNFFGKYSASRSAILRREVGTGKLSFDPERDALIRSAIEGGILSELRGIPFGGRKYREIVSRFGLPIPE